MDIPLALHSPRQLTEHLKSLRRLRGLTQAQVAERLGIKQSRYASIENQPESVSMGQLLKVLAALHAELLLRPKADFDRVSVASGDGW